MAEGGNYLRRCLGEFSTICARKYGASFDLSSVEQKVAHLRRKTPLNYEDLAYFESPEHWWFKRFWVFPPQEHLARALEGVLFDFWNLPGRDEGGLIRKLLYAFKSIELASIILRFVKPEHYAIFSSPTERLLEIRRGRDPVETYLNYLADLRSIRCQYGFDRIADVDMALWVLHEKCFGAGRDPEIEREFSADGYLTALRAKNLVHPIKDLSHARLASALMEIKPDLAALVACYALEILIRKIGKACGGPELGSGEPLEQVIGEIPNYGGIDELRKAEWRLLKDRRNDLMHVGRLPTPFQLQRLIREVLRLEADLEGISGGRRGSCKGEG